MSRDTTRRGMDIRGKGNSHKYFGIEDSDVSFNVISQTNENESSSFSNRQLGKETFGPDQGYMGLYPEEWDHDYSRISAKLPKCRGILAVKEPQGQLQTSSPNTSSDLSNKRDSRDRTVCISVVASASKIFCLETGSIQSWHRCNATSSRKQIPLCISTFLNDQQQDKVGKILLAAPTWQSQTWYLTLLSMSIEEPILLPQYQHLLRNPQKQFHPLLINKTLRLAVWTVSGKRCLHEAFQRQFPNLLPVFDDQVQYQITIRPGHSRLAAVMKEKLIHFNVI